MPRSPSGASARPSPRVSIKSLELNALHTSQIQDMVHLNGNRSNIGRILTKAMRAVADANDELRGVFTVDWNQPAPDGSGKPLIPNEVVHALIQHFDQHDLSNKSVQPDVLGRAYEYLIKQ